MGDVRRGVWFEVPMLFPRGPNGSPGARKRLELAAFAKISRDARARDYNPIAQSAAIEWATPFEGKAMIFALPAEQKS